jgi:peptidoglycan/LPS O-acetylase OafA/YrhL
MNPPVRRIPSLDGLRALSILLVILSHASNDPGYPAWFHISGAYGRFGVRVFFVISGYLITSLLLKEHRKTGTISLRDFYVRRAFRILPAAYIYIAIIGILQWKNLRLSDYLTAIFYVRNFTDGAFAFGHLWSLSVEEQFYFLWPVLLLLFFRRRITIALIGIAIGPIFRGIIYATNHKNAVYWFPAVEDSLATGCLLAILRGKEMLSRISFDRWIVPIAVLTVAFPILAYPHGVEPLLIQTLTNAGLALCVDHVIRHPYWLLNNPFIEWMGRLSYSLYLWQQPFTMLHLQAWWARFPISLVSLLLCASASYYFVEKPFLAMRDRQRSRHLARQATASGAQIPQGATTLQSEPVSLGVNVRSTKASETAS